MLANRLDMPTMNVARGWFENVPRLADEAGKRLASCADRVGVALDVGELARGLTFPDLR